MKLVVIESPYKGEVERNLAYARACLLDSLGRGEAPLASHLLYTQVLNDDDLEDRRIGMSAGHAWIPKADLVAIYCDLDLSNGMRLGLAVAKISSIPTEYRWLGRDWGRIGQGELFRHG